MKKKLLSLFSVILLVSPSLIGTGQVFADTIEPEKPNEVQDLDNKESINKKENAETADSPDQNAASDNISSEIDVKETVESSSIQGHTKETLDSEEHMNESKNFNQDEKIDDDLATETNGTSASVMQTDDIDSGTLGTCEWRIDSEGTLHIGSGNLPTNLGLVCPWFGNNLENPIKKIKFEGEVIAGGSMGTFFGNLTEVTQIENIYFLNTSNVTDMGSMFSGMSSLTSLDVSGFDTSNVTDIRSMFSGLSSLTSLDVSGFDTSNVTDIRSMFSGLSSLTSLDVSGFDTSNVADMSGMFSEMSSLTSLDVSGFDTSNVANMYSMFSGMSSLTSLDVSGFDTSNVTHMNGMFSEMSSLTSLDVSGFDTSNVTHMNGMFSEMSSLTSLDVSGFDTSNVANMYSMFSGMSSLTSLDVSGFDTSNVTDMSGMFSEMSSLTSLDVSGFDTSNVADMSGMFSEMSSLTSLDVSGFDTSNVIHMVNMFRGLFNLKSLTLGNKMSFSPHVRLEDLEVTDVYSGEWIHVLSNRTFTSRELILNYDGSLAGEYIWALKPILKVQDLILYEGNSWDSKNNFISATGKDGNPVDFADVTVEGTVDTSKAGTYEVSYSYEGVTSVATITVKAIQTAVNVHDSTLYVGTKWEASDNFDSAIDKDGKPVDFADVTVEGTVDTSKAGTYEVSYSYEGVTSVATITVKAIQTAVNVHDSTLYVGTKWEASDNFDSAIDKDGKPVDFADVTVEGTVDTSKAGTYEVSYSYEGVTSVATITVKAIQTAVNVHDSTLYVGTKWEASDNFDSAIDKDGKPVDFADVTVEGTVDTSKAGTYEVSYSYEGVTSVATITIRDKEKDSAPSNDNNKGQDSHNTGEKVLPQTGEQTNTIWTLAGFLTILLSLIYLVKKRKKSY